MPTPAKWLLSPTASRPLSTEPMKSPTFAEIIARICARDRRYAADAFVFLSEGLQFTVKAIQEKEKNRRHVTGQELALGLRDYALEQFGPLAMTVLARWGVHTTRDFGEMVFLLIGAGLFGKTEEDKIEDFDDVYNFATAFRTPFLPKLTAQRQPRPRPTTA